MVKTIFTHSEILRQKRRKRWLGLLSFFMLLCFGQIGIAQVNYNQSFTGGANSWTTTGGWSGDTGYLSTRYCSAAGAMRINVYTTGSVGTIVSPLIGTTDGGEVTVTYSYKVTNYQTDNAAPANFGSVQLQYKIGTNGTWTTVQTIGGTGIAHVPQSTCVVRTASFSPPVGELYIRYNVGYTTGDWEFLVDDVSVLTTGTPPSCFSPTALSASSITGNSAVLNWTSDKTDFEISWGTGTFAANSGTIVPLANGGTLSGLSSQTTYNYYVRTKCSVDDVSSWAGPFSFTTLCTAYNAPFLQEFSAGALPICWTNTSSNPVANGLWKFSGSVDYASGNTRSNGTFVWVDGSDPSNINDVTLTTPLIDVSSLTTPFVSFDYFSNNTGVYANNVFTVQVSNGTTWTTIYTNNTSLATWRTLEIPLTSFTGTTLQLRFIVDKTVAPSGNSFYNDILLDNVSVTEAPACPTPNFLTATNIELTSATLSWVSDAPYFDISVGEGTFAPENGIILPFVNGGNLMNLSSGTTYQYYVRAKCGGEQISDWRGPFSFTTLVQNQIGIGTTTGTNLPINSCMGYNYSQQIYLASEIQQVIVAGNKYITKIRFKQTSLGNGANYKDWVVYMKNTTKSSFTSTTNWETGLLQVFSGEIAYNTVGWIEITLNTPFIWDGTSNIVIGVDENTPSWSCTASWATFNSGSNRGIYYNSDSTNPDPNSPGTAVSAPIAAIPQIQFEIEPLPSCLPVNSLTATNFTSNSANLSWTSSGTNFDIKWGTTGFNFNTEGTLVEGFTNGGTLSGLSTATTYQYYVRQNCGDGDTSIWIGPFAFTTACNLPDAPSNITFTAVSTTATTVNWTAPDNAPTGYVVFRSTSNIPPVLVNGTTYSSSSTAIASLTSEGRTYFCTATTTTATSGSAGTLVGNTQYYYFVFAINSQNSCGGAPWYSSTALTAAQSSAPAAPTSFASSNINFDSATVSWTASAAGGNASALNYQVEVYTDATYTTAIVGSPFSSGTSVTQNLTGLTPGTTYFVRVKANNGQADSSYLTGIFATILPGQIGTGTTVASNFPINSGSAFNYTQQIYTKSQVEANLEEDQNFITKVKFFYNGNSSTATPGTSPATTNFENWTIYLGNTAKTSFATTTDWVGVANLEQVFSGNVTFPAAGNWMEIILDTPFQWDGQSNIVVAVDENSASTGTTVYFRSFTSESNTGMYVRGTTNPDPNSPATGTRSSALAQIAFEAIETPECMPVTGITVNNITPYTANVQWSGNDDYYEMEYGLSGFTLGTGNLISDTDNPSGLESLLADTNYDVYVRQMCGGNASPWLGPITFKTAIACPAPTGLTHTQSSATSALLSWVSEGDAFEIKWGATGFNVNSDGTLVSEIDETSFNLTGLISDTNYQFYVRRDCSATADGNSTWTGPYAFKVGYCASVPSSFDNSGITNVAIGTSSFAVSPISYYMYPTPIDIQAGTEVSSAITFATAYTYNTNIWIDFNNNGVFESSELVFQGESTNASPTTYNTSFLLTDSAPLGLRRMRIGTADTGQSTPTPCYSGTWGVTIDLNVNILAPPSCSTPTALTATNITVNSASLGWSSAGTNFDIKWGLSGFDIQTEGTLVENFTNGNTLSGLSASTTYQYYVRQSCGNSEYSAWVGPFSFITTCISATVPYLLDFESVTTPALPNCTSIQNLGNGNNWFSVFQQGIESYGFTTKALVYQYNEYYNANVWFYTQGVELEAGVDYVISYDYGSAGYTEKMKVAYGTSPVNTAMTTQLANHSSITGSTKLNNELVFTPTSSGVYYFGFHAYSDYDEHLLMLDNIHITTKGWTGAVSSEWTNTGNWRGGIPTTTADVVIPSDATNYPVISSNVTIGSLTVQNGASLTVNSNTLTVGAINVATGGTMTVKSGATLWQDANTVNTGNVTIQRNVTLQHLDYTVWSSPVVGQALQAFSPNTLASRIRDYVAGTWVAVPNVNANFAAGKGYMFRAPNVFDPEFYPNAYTWTGSFTGVPQTADEVIAPFTIASNHQSVGNPYPTSIHADGFFDENDPGFANNSGTDILGAMYIWMTDRSDIAATGGDAWALYNPITGGTNPSGGAPHNGIIPAGQGFLLRTRKPIAQLPSVKFTTDMRINAAGTFYRSNTVERHRLWLNLANQETVLNQTLVAYVEGATQGFDASIDTEALSNNGTSLYSLVPNNTDSFMIQGRALPFNDLDVVPMGFRAANAGTYTISLANFDGVFAEGQDIFLVDNLNQVTHNLKEASYTFVSESGEFNSRFSVVYRQDALSVTNPDLNNNWVVYPKNGQFQIETLGFEMKQVIVYDMLGRTVYQSKADGNNHLVDAINANQVLIVKVVTTDNVVLTKKVNN